MTEANHPTVLALPLTIPSIILISPRRYQNYRRDRQWQRQYGRVVCFGHSAVPDGYFVALRDGHDRGRAWVHELVCRTPDHSSLNAKLEGNNNNAAFDPLTEP